MRKTFAFGIAVLMILGLLLSACGTSATQAPSTSQGGQNRGDPTCGSRGKRNSENSRSPESAYGRFYDQIQR